MAYLMAPAPALDHEDIAGEIYFQLRRPLEGKSCRAFIAPEDVRLPKGEDLDEQVDTAAQRALSAPPLFFERDDTTGPFRCQSGRGTPTMVNTCVRPHLSLRG